MLKIIILPLLILLSFSACSSKQLSEKCFEKPESGMCKAYFPKYYFNTKSKSCEKFIWGGCRGNVPFDTIEECKQECEK